VKVTPAASCEGCHRPDTPDVAGIETAHPKFGLSCVDCHGGDPKGRTKAEAHVANPAGIKSLRDLPVTAMDDVDPEYLQFVNPSDLRVAHKGCGSSNPQYDGSSCHQDLVDASRRSMHSTLAGIITVPRYNGSVQQSRLAEKGAIDVEDPGHDPATAPPYTVPSLSRLGVSDLTGKGAADLPDFLGHAMAKRCTKCHINVYGGGTDPKQFGNFRSSGCAACHMVYDNDGLSKSGDPVIDKAFPSHPVQHVLTTAIPDYQCEHCHWRGNRAGTAFKGWRERASGSRDEIGNTLRNDEPLHTRGANFFVIDEDTTNDVDETPPDIHYSRGMGCIDCHVGRDNHGDGRIHTTMDVEMGMECHDCHGTFDAGAAEQGGEFRNTAGDRIPHVSRAGDGSVLLRSLVDGSEHTVTQIASLPSNPQLAEAHDTANHGELECYACHTAWSQNCYGCHTDIDMRFVESNLLDGKSSAGKTAGNRDVVTIDNLHLAINSDGKIGVFMVQNMFFSVIVPCDPATSTATCTEDRDSLQPGRKLIDSEVRVAPDGKLGFSWGPGVPHTTADKETVQPCTRCHPKQDGSNLEQVRLTYGFGNGEYTFTDGTTGITHDLTKMIEPDGTPVVAFAHVGCGPIPIERIEKAMNHRVP